MQVLLRTAQGLQLILRGSESAIDKLDDPIGPFDDRSCICCSRVLPELDGSVFDVRKVVLSWLLDTSLAKLDWYSSYLETLPESPNRVWVILVAKRGAVDNQVKVKQAF